MDPHEQISGVLRITSNAAALNPSGKPFSIEQDEFSAYPDYQSVLNKLEADYKIISIHKKPEIDVYEYKLHVGFVDDRQLKAAFSYVIVVNDNFDEFYKSFILSGSGSKPLRLGHTSYNPSLGTLTLSPNAIVVPIAASGNAGQKTDKETLQCKLMRKVFSSQTSMASGVHPNAILGKNINAPVRDNDYTQIKSTVSAINRKIVSVGGPEKVIRIKANRIFVSPVHLLKS